MGRRAAAKNPGKSHEGIGGIEAAVFGLLGLLLAFCFVRSAGRLDARRELIVAEANAAGTAFMRLDLLPASAQPEIRGLFRDYLDARLIAYRKFSDPAAFDEALLSARTLQQEIWSRSVAGSRGDPSGSAARVLLPALNEMIDVANSRAIMGRTHIPPLIVGLLVAMSLLTGLVAGFALAVRERRSWFHAVLYSAAVAVTLFAILDLDYPRFGMIRLDPVDRALVELRDTLRRPAAP